jgi:hypothetical protein
MCPP